MKTIQRSILARAPSRAGLMVAALLIGVALTGCKINPANLYRTGYDKMLTAENWSARKPDEAVAIIGGFPSVWQKADEPSYVLEARPRITIDWSHGFDVVLVKAGTYQLQTIVLGSGNFADFGGFRGLGAASGPVIASFEVRPGEVVYVGDLDANVEIEAIANCVASLSVKDTSKRVAAAFAKQVSFVQQAPKTSLMTIKESLIRFPCGEAS
jgi:hypothetical protein